MVKTPTERFSHTVENYVKYRPSYPSEVVELLQEKCSLTGHSKVADIGSGTGIFTKLLLEQGCEVYGVEPNREMAQAAEQYLSAFPRFISINAPAEHTNLSDQSVDLIIAAQAFHWFDLPKVKREFLRILKPQGFVVLIWNLRLRNSGIMQAYDALLQKFGTDYKDVCANNNITDDVIRDFCAPNPVEIVFLPNKQMMNWEELKGRLLSTSYVPKPGDNHYDEMLIAAEKMFNDHQQQGQINFDYETKIYISSLT